MNIKLLLASAALVAFTLPAHAQSNTQAVPGAPGETTTGTIMIDTANAIIDGNRVERVGAQIDRDGYIVVHDECAGAPPASLGHLRINANSDRENLSIETTGPIDPACNPSLMLHYETNDNQTYDFGPGMTDVDTPVTTAAGVISEKIPLNN